MMRQKLIMSLFVSLSLGCNDTWIKMGDKCYKISPQKMDHIHAAVYCPEEGGYMVIVNAWDEQKSLSSFLPSDMNYWLGMRGDGFNREWYWMHTDEDVEESFNHWLEDFKFDHAVHDRCAAMVGKYDFQWKDFPPYYLDHDGINFHALCEVENKEK